MSGGPIGIIAAAQQAAPQGEAPFDPFILMMVALFAIFYFLVFRPQQKQRRGLENAIKSAAKGDHVVTAGGLHGKVVSTADDAFTVEIASIKGQPVRVQVSRAKVESVTSAKAAEESKQDPQLAKKAEKKR